MRRRLLNSVAASKGLGSPSYTGIFFDVSGQTSNTRSVAWDGNFFYVIGDSPETVFQYDASGVYTGNSWSVSANVTIPLGITFDGTDFWIIEGAGNGAALKYNASFVYSGFQFSLFGGAVGGGDVTWDGSNLWIVNNLNDAVYQYSLTGTLGVSFSVSAQTTLPLGIAWDSVNFWIISNTTLYKYDATGAYLGFSLDLTPQGNSNRGSTFDGSALWISDLSTNNVFKYK